MKFHTLKCTKIMILSQSKSTSSIKGPKFQISKYYCLHIWQSYKRSITVAPNETQKIETQNSTTWKQNYWVGNLDKEQRANKHYWVDRPWLQSDQVNIKDSFNKQETRQKRLLDMHQPKTKKISRLHLYFSSHNHLVIIVPNPKC